jgi:hypothetical protein
MCIFWLWGQDWFKALQLVLGYEVVAELAASGQYFDQLTKCRIACFVSSNNVTMLAEIAPYCNTKASGY